MLRSYFIIAFRNIVRNKIFSFINIFGLTSGLACCMLILLYAKDELSFDRFHKNIQNIYQLTCHRFSLQGEDKYFAIAAMAQGPFFKKIIPEIESFVRLNRQPVIVKAGKETFSDFATWADENFFTVFSFPLLTGNNKTALQETHSIVISEEASKKYFGSIDATGKILELEIDGHFEPFMITGIAKTAPQNSSIQFSLLVPFRYLEQLHPDNGWMWVSYPTYFNINSNASINAVVEKMNQGFQSEASDEIAMNKLLGYTDKFIWGLQPFEKMHLQTKFEGNPEASNPVYSYILTAIAIFILVIACINFINLSIAQSLKRSKEIGLRKVIGAFRYQLIKQFLGESFFICFIAFVISLGLAALLLPVFNELSNKKLSLEYLVDAKLVVAFVTLFLITGAIAGLYPAIILSGFNPVETLHSRVKLNGKNLMGKALVVLQFSLATFLIICTVFIYLQFGYLTKRNLGYNDKNLLEITIDKTIANPSLANVCKENFESTPGVEKVAVQNVGKFGGKTIANGKELDAVYTHVDENYLAALEIPVIQGRNFSKKFPTDSINSVLVNETFVNETGWKEAVGKTLDYMNFPGWGKRKIIIVGVVEDYHFESLKEKIKPEVLTLESGLPLGKFFVRIKSSSAVSSLQSIAKTYQKLFPLNPFEYKFKDELNYKSYEAESREEKIVGWGAILTVLISCIGLFGLTSLSIYQRTKEIGIRKLLGSGILEICYLLSNQFLLLVFIAFVIAVPIARLMINRWLENFAYKIDISWWVFLATGLLTMAIGLITISYQAIRAARMNPVKSLKIE